MLISSWIFTIQFIASPVCAQSYFRSVAINGEIYISMWAGLVLSNWLDACFVRTKTHLLIGCCGQFFCASSLALTLLPSLVTRQPIVSGLPPVLLVCVWVIYQDCKRIDTRRSIWKAPPLYYIHSTHTKKEDGCDWVSRVRRTEVVGFEPLLSKVLHHIYQTVSTARWKLVFD